MYLTLYTGKDKKVYLALYKSKERKCVSSVV